jgi:hypothetical protein
MINDSMSLDEIHKKINGGTLLQFFKEEFGKSGKRSM